MRKLSLIALLLTVLAVSAAAQQTAPPSAAPTMRSQQGQPPTPPQQTPAQGRGAQTAPPASQAQPSGQRGGGRGAGTPSESTAPSRPGRSWEPAAQNIRVEVAITDTAEKSTRKVVSMLIADGGGGRIRSGNNQGVLNVDANASASSDSSRVQLSVTIEYAPDRAANTTTLNESVTLVLTPGKATLASQSADPGTDRKVSVEVTATIIK